MTGRAVAAAIIAGRAPCRHRHGSTEGRLQRAASQVALGTGIMHLIVYRTERYPDRGAGGCRVTGRRAIAVGRH